MAPRSAVAASCPAGVRSVVPQPRLIRQILTARGLASAVGWPMVILVVQPVGAPRRAAKARSRQGKRVAVLAAKLARQAMLAVVGRVLVRVRRQVLAVLVARPSLKRLLLGARGLAPASQRLAVPGRPRRHGAMTGSLAARRRTNPIWARLAGADVNTLAI